MMEDGKNYGDFLLETINAAKDQFSADELKLLQGEAEKIRDIGNKLAALEETYPEIVQKSLDSDMNTGNHSQRASAPVPRLLPHGAKIGIHLQSANRPAADAPTGEYVIGQGGVAISHRTGFETAARPVWYTDI